MKSEGRTSCWKFGNYVLYALFSLEHQTLFFCFKNHLFIISLDSENYTKDFPKTRRSYCQSVGHVTMYKSLCVRTLRNSLTPTFTLLLRPITRRTLRTTVFFLVSWAHNCPCHICSPPRLYSLHRADWNSLILHLCEQSQLLQEGCCCRVWLTCSCCFVCIITETRAKLMER